MNNSNIILSETTVEDEIQSRLRIEESRILRIIEAIQGVRGLKEWNVLKTELFENIVNILEKDIKEEAKRENPNPLKLNRLSGELKWAERYADLLKLESYYLVQLKQIRIKLYGERE